MPFESKYSSANYAVNPQTNLYEFNTYAQAVINCTFRVTILASNALDVPSCLALEAGLRSLHGMLYSYRSKEYNLKKEEFENYLNILRDNLNDPAKITVFIKVCMEWFEQCNLLMARVGIIPPAKLEEGYVDIPLEGESND